MTETPCGFSIFIPSRGRPAPLRTCLEALTRLDYSREKFESYRSVRVLSYDSLSPVSH